MYSLKDKDRKNRDGKLKLRLMNIFTRSGYILPSLVLAECLFISYVNWDFANTSRKAEIQSYFEYRARDVNERIGQRVIGYKHIPKRTQEFFNATGEIKRAKFKSFFSSRNLEKTYPEIQGVGYSLIIPSDQIKIHIIKVRKEGFSDYKLWPDSIGETYTSIIYLEPFKDYNHRAYGYELFCEPIRGNTMETACDLNKAVIAAKVNLVQETEKDVQAGFLIYLSVYKKAAPQTTLNDRRKNIIGLVYSPFRMKNYMDGIPGEGDDDVELGIYDGINISDETKM